MTTSAADISVEQQNKQTVTEFMEVFSTGDVDGILSRMTPDATWWVAGTLDGISGTKDREGFGEMLSGLSTATTTGAIRLTPLAFTAEGERVAVETESCIHHCMRWIGQACRAFDMMCERATYRFAHGSTLAEKQTIRNWIADSAAEMRALRLMTLHAAWRIDREGTRAARKEIAEIKYFGAKILHDVIDRAVQVHGSLGYSADLPLEFMYRAARAARLYDGPDEVHRDTVARQYLSGYEAPADRVPSEHIPTRRAAALRRFAELLDEQP